MAIVVFLFDKAEWDRAEVKKLSYEDCVQAMNENRCSMYNIVRLEDSVGEDDVELFENYIRVFNNTPIFSMSGPGDSGSIVIGHDGVTITGTTSTIAPTITSTTAWTPAPEEITKYT